MNPIPAKIARPRPVQVLVRMRLFRLLDQVRKRPVIWVTSPPGSGKTTLVRSYLDRGKLKNLWYQVDEGDSDVATLFHYLGLAVRQAAPRSRKPLPQLAPEYGPKPNAFFRLFFQALFARFKTRPVLVFDNYQEVPAEAAFHAAMVEAIEQIPAGGNVFILSRDDPPPVFAQLQVNGLIERIGWDELKLTAREAQQLVALKKKHSVAPALRQQLYELSQGWVAGLLLLLEASGQDIAKLPQGEFAPQVLFNYFGSQIFDRLDVTAREILVQSAFLPTMTAQATEQLTGIAHAGRIIDDLCRRSYFVVGHGEDQSVYEYHPLFRNFLLNRAPAMFDSARLLSIRHRAAKLLVAQGQFEHAVSLYQEVKDEPGIIGVFVQQAPSLFQQRRTETIVAWARALSEEKVQSTPWILYWLGMCAMASDPDKCGRYLGRALELFDSETNPAGVYLSWAGIVSSFLYKYDDMSPLDRWIGLFGELQARHGDFPSLDIEIQVVGSMFGALLFRQPHRIGCWEQRLHTLVSSVADPVLAAPLWTQLLNYYVWAGFFSKGRQLIETLKGKMQYANTPAVVFIYWGLNEHAFYWSTGDFDAASRLVSEIQEAAKKLGLEVFVGQLLTQSQVHVYLARGEFQAAAAILKEIGGVIPPSRRFELGHYHFLVSMTALSQGDLAQARQSARVALDYARQTGAGFPQLVGQFGAARVALAEGDYEQARRHLEEGRSLMSNATVDYFSFLFEARLAFSQGDEAAELRFLRDALALAREHGIVHYPFWSPADMTDFYIKALDAGIETAYVRDAIRKRGLVLSGRQQCARWPWPARVYTLGGFRIERDGETVRFPRKVQRRPLDLLKIIIALGGRDVDAQRVTDELWPDAEGDAAEDALATALRRLRLLLGNPASVILQNKKLSVDERIVWVDVRALEHLLSRGDAGQADLAQVLAVYRGAFLEKETDASWVWPCRQRLRGRVLRELVRQGGQLMQTKRTEEAIRFFEQGLEVESAAEELYLSLMRCYQALGRSVEALEVYDRCRKMLTITLGVKPSRETEALHRALLAN